MNDSTRHRITLSLAIVLFFVTMLVLIGNLIFADKAHADPTPPPTGLYVAKIVPVKHTPILLVTLSNGKTDALRPCVYEDGTHCYWIADRMGDGRGQSFVVTRGHIFKMNLRGL